MRASKFVQSYIDAWNLRDPKRVADHLTPDGIYRDVPENVQQTHDELIGYLNDFFANHRQRYELIGEILTGRDTIAFQYQMLSFENGETDDAPTIYSGAEFMTIDGDAAVTITDYYDVPGVSRPSSPARVTSQRIREQKYAKSGLNDEQLLEYKARLEHIMQSKQLYLSSDLTLPKLAQAVDCSINHLSQVINSGFGVSFFDYLNQYRIAHARELLSRSDGQSHAILNIAFTVGFNSNSAFYAAFKKCVGQTPAQYRRAQLRKPH
jgi:AraC-like DNA-binding protein